MIYGVPPKSDLLEPGWLQIINEDLVVLFLPQLMAFKVNFNFISNPYILPQILRNK